MQPENQHIPVRAGSCRNRRVESAECAGSWPIPIILGTCRVRDAVYKWQRLVPDVVRAAANPRRVARCLVIGKREH